MTEADLKFLREYWANRGKNIAPTVDTSALVAVVDTPMRTDTVIEHPSKVARK